MAQRAAAFQKTIEEATKGFDEAMARLESFDADSAKRTAASLCEVPRIPEVGVEENAPEPELVATNDFVPSAVDSDVAAAEEAVAKAEDEVQEAKAKLRRLQRPIRDRRGEPVRRHARLAVLEVLEEARVVAGQLRD